MKLIIDIDESLYNRVKEKIVALSDIPVLCKAVDDSTPYNPSGDCISREALKKDIEKRCGEPFDYIKTIVPTLKAIDNAPTVEAVKQCKYSKHCGNEDYCSNCHSDHSLFEYYERPQGEWQTVEGYDGDEYYECSNCGEPWELIAGTPEENNMNFCPNCGADMRTKESEDV